LRAEIGADRCQVMVPQTHPPAAEAEVDFGEQRSDGAPACCSSRADWCWTIDGIRLKPAAIQ
jgi:hypothetical protein